MKYLKEFETTAQYEAYIASPSAALPNVSLVTETNGVAYNPDNVKSITDAVITCDSATYNGETQIATNIVVTLSGETLVSGTDYTVSNNDGGINAGDYTFTVNGIGKYSDTKNGTFTINKAQGSVTTAPTAITGLTPTGSAQALVNAGSGTGTMYYRLGSSGDFSTSIPTATAAGNYTVYYKCDSTSNYTESAVGYVACSIKHMHNGHEYVDFNLPSGTKWASSNLNYYYNQPYTYKYGGLTSADTAYTGTENPLSLSRDAARQAWGGSWRMPTKEQIEELFNSDYTTMSISHGQYGWILTIKPKQGSGYITIGQNTGSGSNLSIGFWSCTPDGSSNAYRGCAYFNSYSPYVTSATTSSVSRNIGYFVLPCFQ